jgi:hypothetical protein
MYFSFLVRRSRILHPPSAAIVLFASTFNFSSYAHDLNHFYFRQEREAAMAADAPWEARTTRMELPMALFVTTLKNGIKSYTSSLLMNVDGLTNFRHLRQRHHT